MKNLKYVILAAVMLIVAACAPTAEPEANPSMFPDYTDIAIPYNIAPLNFRMNGARNLKITLKGDAGTYSFSSRGGLMEFPLKKWRSMLEAEKGHRLLVKLDYRVCSTGETESREFAWDVQSEPIDRYLSYRLIEPAYEVWNEIQIEERDVESFNTRIIGDNSSAGKSCMNCHTSNRAGTSFMHLRGANGGTVLNRNGKLTKLNTKTEKTGNTVYGDISADGRFGVFTTADIKFSIHSQINKRMEVYDSRSDLVVLDFDNLTVTDSPAVTGDEYQETFPCFSADGSLIFFCRARHSEQPDSTAQMHYDICVVQFDKETGRIGNKVLTVVPAGDRLSFSHLKCSPDGKWLLATAAQYGTFPVWHDESELWMVNLVDGSVDVMPQTNSYGADTYHSWSSNSRWIVFASKRDDNVYGRPYIAFVGPDGKAGKPFLLPQSDPERYSTTLKTYNLPELYTEPEDYNAHDIARFYNSVENVNVTYRP